MIGTKHWMPFNGLDALQCCPGSDQALLPSGIRSADAFLTIRPAKEDRKVNILKNYAYDTIRD
jgi:hypothetical protein